MGGVGIVSGLCNYSARFRRLVVNRGFGVLPYYYYLTIFIGG